ncbi:MAG: hypothetical protein HY784_10455 [Chloroflexi bacterium]|nr:hypothetical protein [Chloroflexota bacterium]
MSTVADPSLARVRPGGRLDREQALAEPQPGPVALFGSGETSPGAGRVFEALVRRLPAAPRIAILETPAGFEPNSAQVAGRVADFLCRRLQNYRPEIAVIPARKRNTPFSPDDPALLRPMLQASLIFIGPGSPTYAVRQLESSRAWHTMVARHRLGAAIVFASAATIAAGARALPVYEIYKVGEDLHWQRGLDFFGPYGLSLVFIPHWNNAEGGADLDTSRCFMGQARFARLRALLPPDATIVGIDEHTALVVDLQAGRCQARGRGGVTVLKSAQEQHFPSGESFPLGALGPFRPADPVSGVPTEVWNDALTAQARGETTPSVPAEVLALVEERQAARARRDWATADDLRQRIAASGWNVQDTPEGPRLEPGRPT